MSVASAAPAMSAPGTVAASGSAASETVAASGSAASGTVAASAAGSDSGAFGQLDSSVELVAANRPEFARNLSSELSSRQVASAFELAAPSQLIGMQESAQKSEALLELPKPSYAP